MIASKKVHLIAIGGSVMHNLAIALYKNGCIVSGSDDKIFSPSKERLDKYGLLPAQEGWDSASITDDIDEVIVGMHAKEDNPELLKAQELGIPVYSFPEYIFERSQNKQRIVIAGSHGKTTITSMVLHVLSQSNKEFDYLVGANLDGFETMVQLSDAPIIILEGDEYLTSPLDPTPKFLKYQHHIVSISGIAWDHYNVFPDFEEYKKQFELLINATPRSGSVIYNEDDSIVKSLSTISPQEDVHYYPYTVHPHKIIEGKTFLKFEKEYIEVEIFGEHNLNNLSAAKEICTRLGIQDKFFYQSIKSFNGAQRRLQTVAKNGNTTVFNDFAHSPSKAKASSAAVKAQYPNKKLVSCLELHTFSSLNKEFLNQYQNSLSGDIKIVYYNPETVSHKGLASISPADVLDAFNDDSIIVYSDSQALKSYLLNDINWDNTNLLFMSSGNFGKLDLTSIAKDITNLQS